MLRQGLAEVGCIGSRGSSNSSVGWVLCPEGPPSREAVQSRWGFFFF